MVASSLKAAPSLPKKKKRTHKAIYFIAFLDTKLTKQNNRGRQKKRRGKKSQAKEIRRKKTHICFDVAQIFFRVCLTPLVSCYETPKNAIKNNQGSK
jgi:hypothetical protein